MRMSVIHLHGLHSFHLSLIIKTACICRNTEAQVPLYWTGFSQDITFHRNRTVEQRI